MTDTVEALYDAKDMAKLFGLKHPRSAYGLPIKHIRVGRRVFWEPATVRLYLALNTEDAA